MEVVKKNQSLCVVYKGKCYDVANILKTLHVGQLIARQLSQWGPKKYLSDVAFTDEVHRLQKERDERQIRWMKS